MVLGLIDQATGGRPSLTRPAVVLDFAAAASDDGGLGGAVGGLAEAAGDLLGLGGGAATLADQLIALRLRRALAPEVDVAEIWFAPRDLAPPVALADAGTVSLGLAADALAKVFTGDIDTVETRGGGLVRATATNGGRRLAQARLDQSYAEMAPGDIIADLARTAGVDMGDGQGAGETLPRYAIDGHRSLYVHVAELAAAAGRLAAFDADGRLVLLDDSAPGEVADRLVYGDNIIDFALTDRAPHGGEVSALGAGAQDTGSWAWLRKDVGPNLAATGEGPPQRRYRVPGLRSPQAVATRAASAARAGERARSLGRVRAQVSAAVAPGSLVAVEGVPGGNGGGDYVVTRLIHSYDARAGLVTDLWVAKVGEGGDLLGDLLGGLGGLL